MTIVLKGKNDVGGRTASEKSTPVGSKGYGGKHENRRNPWIREADGPRT